MHPSSFSFFLFSFIVHSFLIKKKKLNKPSSEKTMMKDINRNLQNHLLNNERLEEKDGCLSPSHQCSWVRQWLERKRKHSKSMWLSSSKIQYHQLEKWLQLLTLFSKVPRHRRPLSVLHSHIMEMERRKRMARDDGLQRMSQWWAFWFFFLFMYLRLVSEEANRHWPKDCTL